MKKLLRRVLSIFCALALLCASTAQGSSVSLLTSLMGTHLINPTYADYDLSGVEAQHFDAALVILDAGAGESTGKLWYSLTGAQEGVTYVYSIVPENREENRLSFVYFLNRDVWRLTMDTDDGLIALEYLEELPSEATQQEAERVLSQRGLSGRMLNSDYFWQYVIHIIVNVQAAAQSSSGEAAGVSYGWGPPAFHEPQMSVSEQGWPVTVDLCVEMTITDEMSDFIFSINGETTVPAYADQEAGLVTGSFSATKNGLYVVFLGYKYDGNDMQERVEINIDQVDEEAFAQHEHSFVFTPLEAHPHIHIECSECGEKYDYRDDHAGPGFTSIGIRAAGCCLCGHTWEDSYHDGKMLRSCMVCGQRWELITAESIAWQDYVELLSLTGDYADIYREKYGVDIYGSTPWRILANQGTDLLQDFGFVFWTELTAAYTNPAGTVIEAAGDMVVSEDDYTRQKIDLWKAIIHETLAENTIDMSSAEAAKFVTDWYNFTDGSVGTIQWAEEVWTTGKVSDWGKFTDSAKKTMSDTIGVLQENYDSMMLDYETSRALERAHVSMISTSSYADFDDVVATAVEKSAEADSMMPEIKEAGEQLDELKGQHKVIDAIPYVLLAIESVLAGTDKAAEVSSIRENYIEMICNYDHYAGILYEIMEDAEAMGNDELYTAAEEVLLELTEKRLDYYDSLVGELDGILAQIEIAVDDFGTAALGFVTGAGSTAAVGLMNIGVDAALGLPFALVSFASGGASLLSSNDNISKSAQMLLAYSDMTSSMNLNAALGNSEQDDYSYQLWAHLQIRACQAASQFVGSFEKGVIGRDLDCISLDEDDVDGVNAMLDTQIGLYEQFLLRRTGG